MSPLEEQGVVLDEMQQGRRREGGTYCGVVPVKIR